MARRDRAGWRSSSGCVRLLRLLRSGGINAVISAGSETGSSAGRETGGSSQDPGPKLVERNHALGAEPLSPCNIPGLCRQKLHGGLKSSRESTIFTASCPDATAW